MAYHEKLLVTRQEAARILSCHPNTIINLSARGVLREVRIGTSVRILLADIQKLIREQIATPRVSL
jgi:excisionase family DNA binding protein